MVIDVEGFDQIHCGAVEWRIWQLPGAVAVLCSNISTLHGNRLSLHAPANDWLIALADIPPPPPEEFTCSTSRDLAYVWLLLLENPTLLASTTAAKP